MVSCKVMLEIQVAAQPRGAKMAKRRMHTMSETKLKRTLFGLCPCPNPLPLDRRKNSARTPGHGVLQIPSLRFPCLWHWFSNISSCRSLKPRVCCITFYGSHVATPTHTGKHVEMDSMCQIVVFTQQLDVQNRLCLTDFVAQIQQIKAYSQYVGLCRLCFSERLGFHPTILKI